MPFDLKESNQFGISNMLVKGCIIQPNFVLVVSLQDKRKDSSTDPLLQAEFDKHPDGLSLIFLNGCQFQDVSFPTRQVSSNLEFIWSSKSVKNQRSEERRVGKEC